MIRSTAYLLALALISSGCTESYHPAKSVSTATTAPDTESAGAGPDQATDPHAGVFPAGDPHAGLFPGGAAGGGGAESKPMPFEGDADAPVAVGAVQLTAPEGWVRQQPRNEFVNAEFTLPKAEGDPRDGRLTVSTAGGSIDANVDRWRGQFGDKPKKDEREELEAGGLKVTVIDLAGSYNDQPGPFAPGVQREGYRMLAAIIPVGDQLHFVKAYGPEKTMAEHEDAFHAFVQSVRKK